MSSMNHPSRIALEHAAAKAHGYSITPRSMARALNLHHAKTGAGFYSSLGRHYEARVSADGMLQVSDRITWSTVVAHEAAFHDHNGRRISLSPLAHCAQPSRT